MRALAMLLVAGVVVLGALVSARAEPPGQTAAAGDDSLAPLAGDQAVSEHAPFLSGECAVCHPAGSGPRPGKIAGNPNASCKSCHDQIGELTGHGEATASACVKCHNPHNARAAKLLR